MKWLQEFWKSLTGRKADGREAEPKRPRLEQEIVAADSTAADDGSSAETTSNTKQAAGGVKSGSKKSARKTKAPAQSKQRQTGSTTAGSTVAKKKGRPKRKPVILQVGVDFGTSTTKIAFRQLSPRGPVRPILFAHELPGVPAFGLPSVAAFDEAGTLRLGVDAAQMLANEPWWQGLRGFKVLLASAERSNGTEKLWKDFQRYAKQHLQNGQPVQPETITSVYLAYVMRQARNQISELPEYSQTDVEFLFNVCVPMEHVESSPALVAFSEALARAEALEKAWPVNADTEWLSDNYVKLQTQSAALATRVFIIPESVAEAASYVSSLRRRPGLHALIDIGAGTTDVSFFNLKEEGGMECSYWYSSANLPIGGIALERAAAGSRTRWTTGEISGRLEALKDQSGSNVPETVRAVYESIHRAAQPIWSKAFDHLHIEGPWHEVDVFLAGGGSEIAGALSAFENPWWPHLIQQGIRYNAERLPEPDDYDSLGGRAPFPRLAVAYGLTFPEPELGAYTMPGDCPDHTPPALPRRSSDSPPRWV
jgi:hypothetical protein